jgi:hypothetical protein
MQKTADPITSRRVMVSSNLSMADWISTRPQYTDLSSFSITDLSLR